MSRDAVPAEPPSWAGYWDAPDGVDADGWRRDARAFVDAASPVVRLHPGDDVLDVGCGPGYAMEALVGRVRSLTGVDVSPRAIASARERFAGRDDVALHAIDPATFAGWTALHDRRFSVVLCNSVLQYLPSHEAIDALLVAIHGACAPGARVLLSDLPTGGGRLADAWGLLRGARRQGRLREAWRRLWRLRRSAYGDMRRRLGLLAVDVPRLMATARALGGDPAEVSAPLTILSNRRHVLVRF